MCYRYYKHLVPIQDLNFDNDNFLCYFTKAVNFSVQSYTDVRAPLFMRMCKNGETL